MTAGDSAADLTKGVYDVVLSLPAIRYGNLDDVPPNGVELAFGDGESIQTGGSKIERIVQVGINDESDRLPPRIEEQFWRSSILRRHVGAALLNREGADMSEIARWKKRKQFPKMQDRINTLMQEKFWFRCVPVDDPDERQSLLIGLIALLAFNPGSRPSEDWLGHDALERKIRQSGLWNVHYVEGHQPLTMMQLRRLQRLASYSGS